MKRILSNLVVSAAAFVVGQGTASAELAYAITGDARFLQFDTSNPSAGTQVGFLTGAGAGQQIVGIDFQPSSLGTNLVALGFNQATNFVQLYSVNLTSGALTAFGTGQTLGSGTFAGTPSFGFDFNPSSGGIRITTSLTSSTGQNNFRFNATGTTLTVDTALAYAAGDPNAGQTPQIVGAAYTNNTPGTPTTTLYGYDFGRNALVTVGSLNGAPNSPNSGILNTVGQNTVGFGINTPVGFDISSASGTGYLSVQNSLINVAFLYSISGLAAGTPGTPTLIGNFGTGFAITGIAVIPEPGSVALSALGLGALALAARRRGAAQA